MGNVQAPVKTTVICAVWHRDPCRHDLLLHHQLCLDDQTVPVNRIYVFDGGDTPPKFGLDACNITASEPLTIYQAWNLALSQVETPFVINLNLDDRLAPDAIEKYEACMESDPNSGLVGGDWKICYTQADTDAVEPCRPCTDMPFIPDWPPITNSVTRLGSGDGKRGTLGPAVMWRMENHIGAPRYPWKFENGDRIKVVADVVWWTLVTQQLKRRAYRLPFIVGNYHSHPLTQAEFRDKDFSELKRANEMGISIL